MPSLRGRTRLTPSSAEKYKLYKKLSKAAAAAAVFSNLSQSNVPPSTPPPEHQSDRRPSLILSNKRPVEPAGPLSCFNPFSPLKNKGKQKDSLRSSISKQDSPSNPFATPVKAANAKRVARRSASPDLFPLIQPLQAQVSDFQPPTSALSRARKRLRGDPVSPSPTKEKRRRVISQASLPLPKLTSHAANGDESDNQDDLDAANSSFVNDSPVKRPVGGKSFALLFDEAVPQSTTLPKTRGKFSRSKTVSTSMGLFAEPSQKITGSVSSAFRGGADMEPHIDKSNRRRNGLNATYSDDLSLDKIPGHSSAEADVPLALTSRNEDRRGSAKRSFSNSDILPAEAFNGSVNAKQLPLLPPSPPPPDQSSLRYKVKDAGKGMSRKKAKLLEEVDVDGDDDEDAEGDGVRLVEPKRGVALRSAEHDADIDLDALLFAPRHVGIDDDTPLDDAETDESEFCVDLPERLQQVLAITPPKARDFKQERVVRGLLYGGRAAQYDPRRGGEIWEVGEAEDDDRDTEAEDDWEAEPVPWEVGEL